MATRLLALLALITFVVVIAVVVLILVDQANQTVVHYEQVVDKTAQSAISQLQQIVHRYAKK